MKIGIIGWYNHGNYGDDRILYCLKRFFSGWDFLVCGTWQDVRDKIDELNRCDYILIGGGGLVLRGYDNFADIVSNFKRPFGLVGIGVETKHKSAGRFLDIIKEKAEFILVRDKASKIRMDNHYKVIVGPDLTFLFPLAIAQNTEEDIAGVNLRHWHFWKSEIYGNTYKVMRRVHEKFPMIKKNYPFAKWDEAKTIDIIKNSFSKVVPMPMSFSDPLSDANILQKYYENIPAVFMPESYNLIRFLVGMRLHSLIFSMQTGKPFVSLSYQPKNFAFCQDNDIIDLSCDIYQAEKLKEKIDFMKENYDFLREKIISQREKNISDIHYIFKSLFNFISNGKS